MTNQLPFHYQLTISFTIMPQNQLAWLTYHLDGSEELEEEGEDEGVEEGKVYSEPRAQLAVTLESTSWRGKFTL